MQLVQPLIAPVAGTGSSATLIGLTAGQSIHIWQMLCAGTTTDTVSIVFTNAGTATTIKIAVTNGIAVLPATGVPWAVADAGTAITFTGAATTLVTAYYTKGIGG